MTWAHHALREGDRKGCCRAWRSPCCSALTFTAFQAYEYSHARLRLHAASIFGSTFFMATGFHGFHVIIGTIFLAVCMIRA